MAHEGRDYTDPYQVYEVADNIYWVGFPDRSAGFSNNPYLVKVGDEAVLIDPGSLVHYHVVAKKVLSLVEPHQIRTIVAQHQDPDLCASIPRFEALIERRIRVVVPPWASTFMPYYGITSELILPEDGQTLIFGGQEFQVFYTPYVHFAQTMITWDPRTRTVFSSDIGAGLSTDWRLYADEQYIEDMRAWAEPYIGRQEAWESALEHIRSLEPQRICPQHGCIIEGDIDHYLDAMKEFRVGAELADRRREETS